MHHRYARLRLGLTTLVSVALTATLLTSYGAPATAATTFSPSGAEQQAGRALDHARAVLDRGAADDLTIALRDVAVGRDALTGQERATADALLARPDDAGEQSPIDWTGQSVAEPACSHAVCVHYVVTGEDAPPLSDSDAGGTPDYVESVLATFTAVRLQVRLAGYRHVRADGTRGGDSRFDVYLGDVGVRHGGGYCVADEPTSAANRDRGDRYAFCVVDDDFAPDQFGDTHTPSELLQVTAAHQYFHAVQFAYDAFEDGWFLEATATWIEDELYDDVDRNVRYLHTGQPSRPHAPLDSSSSSGFQYGTWLFIRFLTERYPKERAAIPELVLDVFKRVDAAPGGRDDYSWRAIDRTLRTKGTSAAAVFGRYSVANRRPMATYVEGRANAYPAAHPYGSSELGANIRGYATGVRLGHLSSMTVRVAPHLLGRRWRVRLKIRMSPPSTGSSAYVTVVRRDGGVAVREIALDSSGRAAPTLAFTSSTIRWVEVTLANGGARFDCFSGGGYSCQGRPVAPRVLAFVNPRAYES